MSDSAVMGPAATALVQGVSPETQVVRLRNVGDTDFISRYANVTYEVKAGTETIVPFLAMCLWLGHPDAVDIDKKRQYRHDEFMRLNARYGAYDNLEMWFEVKPKLEAYHIDGRKMITVVDDYLGDHLTPDTGTSVQEKAAMLAAMAAMQEQMAAMQAQMAAMERGEAALELSDLVTDQKVAEPEGKADSSSEVTVDKPTRIVVG